MSNFLFYYKYLEHFHVTQTSTFIPLTDYDIPLTILYTVGHSQYIIILIYYQYHSNIAIHYCHTDKHIPLIKWDGVNINLQKWIKFVD